MVVKIIGGLFKFIFKIIFFPFRLIFGIFKSRERRRYDTYKSKIDSQKSTLNKALNSKNLDDSRKKELKHNLSRVEEKERHLKDMYRNMRKVKNDNDNVRAYRRMVNSKKKMRKA